ncbi:GNAT family N-acetyltransferase [Ruicaihuangia caeni]|uniref:GNAT family N-acetyltransferase n=1 Tax=Ruicaihuangia caeni TaxID=3042517 RepID=UPI00338F340E
MTEHTDAGSPRARGPWLLRRASVDDLDAIMGIEQRTFPTDAWSREGMHAELVGAHRYYLVAIATDAGGTPATSETNASAEPRASTEVVDAYAGLLAPPGAAQGDIQTIAVEERARGKGLGRLLMHALIAEARRRGIRELFLEVRADNPPARHLYDALGFAQVGVRPRYYQPDGVDAIVMRLDLPEARMEFTDRSAAVDAASDRAQQDPRAGRSEA